MEDPVFSPPRGLFTSSEPVSVTISSPTPGAEIYWTADGSEPIPGSGEKYTGTLSVQGTPRRPAVTLRAIAVRSGMLPSRVVTATYIFLDQVPRQSRVVDVWPSTWRNHPAADYEMDPQIVSKPAYAEDLPKGLLELPSVSIVTDIDNLTGPRGIYVNPTNSGVAWERPASLEIIYADGRNVQADCGLRIQGGASRQPNKSPKHSFRVLFKGQYGPGRLRFPLFPDSPVSSFDTLIFRGNFNNSWIHWNGTQRSRAQHIRDQWARDTQIAMEQASSHGIFVHLYLNGLYWGMYNLVERPSRAFSASNFGGVKDDYAVLNSGEIKEVQPGTQLYAKAQAAWSEVNRRAAQDLRQEQNYRQLAEMLDLAALADYMIINFYGSNEDWPAHNWYATCRINPIGKWRFFCWDSERILESPSANKLSVSNANSPAYFFARLRVNPEFLLLFADRVHKHFFNNGCMTPEAVRDRWLARAREVHNAAVAESARWGDYRRDVHSWRDPPYELYERDNQMLREENRLLNQYFPVRSQTVLRQFRSARLYPSIEAPEFNKHGGRIERGFQLSISVPGGTSGEIFYTLDGSDPCYYDYNQGAFQVSPTAIQYKEPITLEETTLVKARHRDGSVWSALTEAVFTVPQPLDDLVLTEIMYHPPDTAQLDPDQYEFIELKNVGDRALDLTGVRITGGVSFAFPEGTVLPSGRFIVLVSNMSAFKQKYPNVSPFGEYQGRLSNSGDVIELRDPAGEVVWQVAYSDLAPWPENADGWGFSLVPINPQGADDPNDPSAWRISTLIEGSPGADDKPTQAVAPRIVSQPEDVTVVAGGSAVFSVQATAIPAPTYRWQRNGEDIPGATEPTYVIEAVTLQDDGARFRCVVTNEAGSATSREAVLHVLAPVAPTITTEPQDLTVLEGDRAVFSCRADGLPAPTYRWQRNGEDIPGATESTYVIEAVTLQDDGARFRCVVTNEAGSAVSREALLTVLPRPKPFRRMDSNADGTVDIGDAIFLLQVQFSGTSIPCEDAGDVNDDGSLNIADPIALLSYLFATGFMPPPPATSCGPDPTEDALSCDEFPPCAR